MDRRAMAEETLEILWQGYYEPNPTRRIAIKDAVEQSVRRSVLLSPSEGERILEKYRGGQDGRQPETRVENLSAVKAIRILAAEGKTGIGVLRQREEAGRRPPERREGPGGNPHRLQLPLPHADGP